MSPRAMAATFRSAFAREIEAFLAYRRDLATYHEHLPVALRHLDRFVADHAPDAHALTQPLVTDWMVTLAGRAAITRRNYFRVVRQFCVFRARGDPAAFVPDTMMCPRVTARFRPYIYSEQDIRALLTAAARLDGGLRPHTYVTLLLVLYTTGLRIGEAIRLQLGDLDRDRAVLHVRIGKFRKSRLVPITASLLAQLDTYLEHRRHTGARADPEARSFGARVAGITATSACSGACPISCASSAGNVQDEGRDRACTIFGSMPGPGLCRVQVLPEGDSGGSREGEDCGPGIIRGSPRSGAGGLGADTAMV